ncbi:hypothetical protein [Streptomyces sp. CB01881]|uniref:hypothetical protein n=1 Tax=Streptomyces sp. CB01881 TaxID=2078691 RepID=UPI000CDBFBA3|nr:hypothetical protein [Streptomyces sp. CB01881]AUY48143.1 hypothetical protein C2142_03275 [Streptomyces sp. CB01881]TYC76628.1 hypothetical protein EH183_03285 [Streptomyces sp. CB01881]
MAVTVFQQQLRDRFLAAPVVAPPPPWRPVGRGLIPVGGLLGIGFATDPATGHDLVLTVSGTGHGLFDAVTGEKIEREYDPEEEPDGPDLSCPGIGPVADVRIPVAGLYGGGLHTGADGGWHIEVVTPEWPNGRVLLCTGRGPFEGGHGENWWHVYHSSWSTFRAAGFSPSGRTLAVATSSDLTLWTRAGTGG